MEMWDSVSVKNFVVPVLHLQIGLGNDVKNNLLDFIDSDVDKLFTDEEMARNTMVTLNQIITKKRNNFQIWYVNDGVIFRSKSIQLKCLQEMKESTLGLNDDIVITISSAKIFVKEKKEERKKIVEEISQLLTRGCTLIKNLNKTA